MKISRTVVACCGTCVHGNEGVNENDLICSLALNEYGTADVVNVKQFNYCELYKEFGTGWVGWKCEMDLNPERLDPVTIVRIKEGKVK